MRLVTTLIAVSFFLVASVPTMAVAQTMPKPGGGRCVTYAESQCGGDKTFYKGKQACMQAAIQQCKSQTAAKK